MNMTEHTAAPGADTNEHADAHDADATAHPSATALGFDSVADGFNFPTSLAFDDEGVMYVAESGLPFGGAPAGGRLWRVKWDGSRTLVSDNLRQPVNGVTFHAGALYVAEGGHPGRISRFTLDGRQTVILDNLPGPGNYHTNMAVVGPDDKLYFSQGALTNTGVIGLDAYELGWLRRLPHAHDTPGLDITLAGFNCETENPLNGAGGARAVTGAFVPFGTRTRAGQRVASALPCTASVMRCDLDGSNLELVAWGLRNAYGLGFLPNGDLLAVDQGADDRGSRPVGNVPDYLFRVRAGAWYGWPDFFGGEPVTSAEFLPERGSPPEFVLSNHAELPPPERPLLKFPPHVSAVKFDVERGGRGRWGGHVFVALFGDERPMTAPDGPRAGRGVARIDPTDWSLHPFASGPPLRRPIDVRFHPSDGAMYVLDFGDFEMEAGRGVAARAGTGKVWKTTVTR